MNEKVINIHKYEEGNEDVIVEFGSGKIGIGLASESQRNMIVRLQELNKANDVGAFLTKEEREDNFKKTCKSARSRSRIYRRKGDRQLHRNS